MNRLIIIGASGHGKVVADIARLSGYEDIVFLDNDKNIKSCAGYRVYNPDSMVDQLNGDVFIAVGSAETRKRLMNRENDRHFPVLIHPDAIIAPDVVLGKGTVVMAGTVINPGVRIGNGCIVNTSSSIDHDCTIGDFCHVSVGSHLAGAVTVGNNTWVGIGSVISNNINICSDVTIGAGAVVIRDIVIPGTYIGVPARMVDKQSRIDTV